MLGYLSRNLRYLWPSNWRAGSKALYRRLSRSGVLEFRDELGMASLDPTLKVRKIVELVKPHTVLDVGCGTGRTLAQLSALRIAATGIEASRLCIEASQMGSQIIRADLRKPVDLSRRFDLVWCFEVAEHIHRSYVETFLDSLVRHSTVVALSAAPPGQGGEGHVNEQPQSYWREKFATRGYRLQPEWTAAMQAVPEFYSQNMMVFVRS